MTDKLFVYRKGMQLLLRIRTDQVDLFENPTALWLVSLV